jgi:hypothetical protein
MWGGGDISDISDILTDSTIEEKWLPIMYEDIAVYLRCEVLTAVAMKNTAFWVTTACSAETARRFGGNIVNIASLTPASAGFLLGLIFDPGDRGDMFLRNVG